MKKEERIIRFADVLTITEALVKPLPKEKNGDHLRRLLKRSSESPAVSDNLSDDDLTRNLAHDLATFMVLTHYLQTCFGAELIRGMVNAHPK